MAREPVTVQSVVAGNVRRLRERAGWSQDDVAANARRFGVQWQRSTVANIENGRKAPSIEVLAVLSSILVVDGHSAARSRLATFADLLKHHGPVLIDDGVTVEAGELIGAVRGDPVLLEMLPTEGPRRPSVIPLAGPFSTQEELTRTQEHWREADQRAAARVGLTADAASLTMARLWGMSLSELSAQRADDGSPDRGLAQRKGRETRRLTAELEADALLSRGLRQVSTELSRASRDLTLEQWREMADELERWRIAEDLAQLPGWGDALDGDPQPGVYVPPAPWVTRELFREIREAVRSGDGQ